MNWCKCRATIISPSLSLADSNKLQDFERETWLLAPFSTDEPTPSLRVHSLGWSLFLNLHEKDREVMRSLWDGATGRPRAKYLWGILKESSGRRKGQSKWKKVQVKLCLDHLKLPSNRSKPIVEFEFRKKNKRIQMREKEIKWTVDYVQLSLQLRQPSRIS